VTGLMQKTDRVGASVRDPALLIDEVL
jgi:hypothetical protein